MLNYVIWAVLTSLVSGGAWAGIVVYGRQKRLIEQQAALLEQLEARLDRLEDVSQRLGEAEERLDFTERVMLEEGDTSRRPPGPQSS